MNVSLTEELDSFVKSLVEGGEYYSASEVVRDGLRLLKEKEALKQIRLNQLKEMIMEGKRDMEAGRYTTISTPEEMDEFMEGIKKRGEAKLKQKQKPQKEKV